MIMLARFQGVPHGLEGEACLGALDPSKSSTDKEGKMNTQQSMDALAIANQVRLAGAAVVAEVACDTLSITVALSDPRADCLPVSRLLCAQRGWGPKKANALLAGLGIRPTRRVSELTERQREEVGSRSPVLGGAVGAWTLRGRIEFMAEDAQAMADGLRAALVALHQGVEPNIIWAPGYRLAIMVGDKPRNGEMAA